MSRFEKVLKKFLSDQSIVTFKELEYLLGHLGYKEQRTGKTSGSRRAYIHTEKKHIIRVHKPHPGNELKKYVKRFVVKELIKQGLI